MSCKVVYLEKKKLQPLSKLMLVALVDAYSRQKHNIPFGPADIKDGSVAALISRGLIVNNLSEKNTDATVNWQVTTEAIEILKSIGVDIVKENS